LLSDFGVEFQVLDEDLKLGKLAMIEKPGGTMIWGEERQGSRGVGGRRRET